MAVNSLATLRAARYNAFRWRCGLNAAQKLALALAIAAATGLMAQVRIPLPWTPVPITGQTFAVVLAGVLLGQWWGGISMALYAGLGVLGVPWFTGWAGGLGHLAGPTGGYIIGFILAAMLMGYFTDRYIRSRSFVSMFGLMLFANFVLIYLPGLLQLNLWLNLVQGQTTSIYETLSLGFFPFIIGDVIKLVAAAGVARAITPKEAYNREVDRDKEASWRLP
jgi:biotin transport system substrate-specific component